MSRGLRAGAAAVLALQTGLGGCAKTPTRALPLLSAGEFAWCCTREDEEEITIEYLGVGGWLFRFGDAALLTAPFFSNPGFLDVGLGRIEADTAAIDRFLPPVEEVEAILVGHAHYDHLMDVPYILRRKAPAAHLYGSRTAVNLVRGDPEIEPARLHAVEAFAGDRDAPGEWIAIADGRIRIMPLRSAHAPHFMGIHLYEGEVAEPAEELPRRATGWLEGLPLAFLIDFLSPEGEVLYRVHYQDAASTPPLGLPPAEFDGIPVDLAILCPPGYQEVEEYPEGILTATAPRHVLLGHWEDFFTSRSEPLRGVRGTDLNDFIARMGGVLPRDGRWGILEPGSVIRIGEGG